MPQFFSKNALTEEQQLRWNEATAEYARIQEENLLRNFSAMSPADKVQYRTLMGVPAEDDLLQHMRSSNTLFSINHTPGEKSALFARLLDGKAALPYPPPTSYSYPWYDSVEQAGPFSVNVERLPDMHNAVGPGDEDALPSLTINQCSWRTVEMNGPAKYLLDLEALRRSPKEQPDGGDDSVEASLNAAVRKAYAGGPQFIVQHSYWPAMRLRMGRSKSSCVRAYANARMSGASMPGSALRSVLDAGGLYLNGEIGATLSLGEHPRVRLEDARVKMEARRAMPGVDPAKFALYFEAANFASIEKNYAAASAEYEANPDCRDWVELFTDGWVLERM